jgi:hypothetical protein
MNSRQSTRSDLRRRIRVLKAQGKSYREIGELLTNGKGKPLGSAAAMHFAQPNDGECPSCLRRLERVK